MKKLRWINFDGYPASSFPSKFQPKELGCLELKWSKQKELWHGYKLLPNLKILNLGGSGNLIKTPDFGGLPCLQRLLLKGCWNLEEIHPSIGYHEKVVYVDIGYCSGLKRFPPIIRMKSLETFDLCFCDQLQEFPDIHSNMDSLVSLILHSTGIEIIPSSVGEYCTNLVSFKPSNCMKLKRIEGNFHFLNCLKDLYLGGRDYIGLHQDRLVSPRFPCSLRKLNLSSCNFGNGDIPSNICELLNLQVLDLRGNKFSQLHSSISRLPCLKYLDLSYCKRFVELPDLPSSIAILKADCCDSLESAGDLSGYKWLWKVSLWRMIGGERVLLSVLEGNAVKDRFMSVITPKVEPSSILTGFVTLQLPHNWYNDFSGFLLSLRAGDCNEEKYDIVSSQEMSTDHSEEFVEDWEQYDCERVGYVPFSSLRHIPWLNPTYTKNISFQTNSGYLNVELVRSISKIGDLKECQIDYSECWHEEYEDIKTFEIIYDSNSSSIHIGWTH